MGALTDLWKSERGLLAVLIIIGASVLTGLDKMTIDGWQTFVTGIFIAYAAGKTITSAMMIARAHPNDLGLTEPEVELVEVPAVSAPAPAPATPL